MVKDAHRTYKPTAILPSIYSSADISSTIHRSRLQKHIVWCSMVYKHRVQFAASCAGKPFGRQQFHNQLKLGEKLAERPWLL